MFAVLTFEAISVVLGCAKPSRGPVVDDDDDDDDDGGGGGGGWTD